MSSKIRAWIKDGLWIIVFSGLLASILRFSKGLGAATGMNDSVPWGLWIAFKLVFVAFAGGGFTLAGMVYIFRMDRYRPILRRAILIALLGYGSFIVSLIFDLGLPWHIYMPIINWQHHSVMFEIAWCVILYFSVLILEFSPVILEHPWFRHPIFKTLIQWLHRLTLPLIISGIILSTLHQSSLGSLFLIMPHRVHPLWYSPWIPYMFFTSAIAAGMMALIVEGFLVERWFHLEKNFDLLNRLGKGAILPLGLYLTLRISDQWIRGVLPGGIDGSWQSILYLGEILLGSILPIILLSIKKVRQTQEGLITSATLVLLGIMSQRMSLSMFTMIRAEGTQYSPAFGEIVIAVAIPSAAILIYLFLVENLNVYGNLIPLKEDRIQEIYSSGYRPQSSQKKGIKTIVAYRSGFAIFTFALSLPLLSMNNNSPPSPVSASTGWEIMHIDGNRSGYVVDFPHEDHQVRLADNSTGENECQVCHHLDKPNDESTACWECHRDFYQPASIFDHNLHQMAFGGNQSCSECHTQEHIKQTAEICSECHEGMLSQDSQSTFNMVAPSYKEAMHGLCKVCHEVEAEARDMPELMLCGTCHSNGEKK